MQQNTDYATIYVQIKNKRTTYEKMLECIERLLFFSPTECTSLKKYSEEKMQSRLKRAIEKNEEYFDILSHGNDKEESFVINRMESSTLFVGVAQRSHLQESNLVDAVTWVFEEANGLCGYIVSHEDERWQNNDDIKLYKIHGRSLDGIDIIPRPKFKNQWMVDIKQFPGHSLDGCGIFLGSCWMMWYGRDYFEYVSEDKLVSFKDCDENMRLSNGGVRIKLYDDPFHCEDEENRRRQWSFREHVELEEVYRQLQEKRKEEARLKYK